MSELKFNIPHRFMSTFIPLLSLRKCTLFNVNIEGKELKAVQKKLSNYKDVAYVDAAEYPRGHKSAISVVGSTGNVATAASILASSEEEVEEAVVALAETIPNCSFIVTDSKTAICNFGAGRVCKTALAILSDNPTSQLPSFIWTPANAGLIGNEMARASARAFRTKRRLD